MSTVLVVDDDLQIVAGFVDLLETQGHRVVSARAAEAALPLITKAAPDLIILDVFMPGISGLEALRQFKQIKPDIPVILITGQGDVEIALQSTKAGAFDYQLKPFDPEEMLRLVEAAIEHHRLLSSRIELGASEKRSGNMAIIGNSAAMQQVYKTVGRVAQTDATVLIQGESGTGKELVARAIYQNSKRSQQPLVTVNSVAIPDNLLESELFGYERGAFTGATSRRMGKFEQAQSGTIFLDEIGDLPKSLQAKLLRVLQEHTVERLGGNQPINVDVRVLAATNRDLSAAVGRREFREDLFHRLNVVTIRLPPLREHREDLAPLVEFFLRRTSLELGIEPLAISPDALAALENYSWPGNIRELEHCLQRIAIFVRGHTIQVADVRAALTQQEAGTTLSQAIETEMAELVRRYLGTAQSNMGHQHLLERLDSILVNEALQQCRGNQTRAARLLGLPRPTLHAKIQKYLPLPNGIE
ncbi:MAG: sigma-54-dependent Fis family transcriptional regulator [Planctomycetes bacterium]|nr:sigma-54-dependent Fis family transcriptional regulator [Planctomycetota bacterium]